MCWRCRRAGRYRQCDPGGHGQHADACELALLRQRDVEARERILELETKLEREQKEKEDMVQLQQLLAHPASAAPAAPCVPCVPDEEIPTTQSAYLDSGQAGD